MSNFDRGDVRRDAHSGAHRPRLPVEPVEEPVVRGGLAVGIRTAAKRLTLHPLVRYTFRRSPYLL